MALPFDLPAVSRATAALTPGARAAGSAIAAAAARGLTEVLGCAVTIEARALPAVPAPGGRSAALALDLPALPGSARLEVEPSFVVRLVDRMAGGAGAPEVPALALTPVEASFTELLALAALDGAAAVEGFEARLAPRLARDAEPPAHPLAVALAVDAGGIRGRALLALPLAAIRAFAGEPALSPALAAFPVDASLRGPSAPVAPEELEALAPGDVLVCDPPPDGRHALVFPGGFTVLGAASPESLLVEELTMPNRLAEIPLVLEVELCRVPLTLADLAALEPGATLPLPVDRRGLVVLRLGERAFARGELVELDGAVGVRITAVEAQP
jgi:type III secretion protein Q